MRIEREHAVPQIQNHVIAADGFQCDGHRARICAGNILRNAIFCFGDNSIGDGECLLSIGAVIFVIGFVAVECDAIGEKLDPIDCEALRNPASAVHGNQSAAMAGCVGWAIRGDPVISAEGRSEHDDRLAFDGERKGFNREVIGISADLRADFMPNVSGTSCVVLTVTQT